jgi:delta8-fatty-acid desaturase
MKDRRSNDTMSLFLGNIAQGFSRDWWKLKHNNHHAATNIIDMDDDIDLSPLFAFVPDDLRKYRQPIEEALLRIIPYQHLYFTFALPLLRFSWTAQSIQFAFAASTSNYVQYRKNAFNEQCALLLHWLWVIVQLYLLPSNTIRVIYFLLSQCGGGLLIAHVVTFNHNSTPKFPANCRLMNNFACLHILTTRNMRPSVFIDWLWGGLNYQIEHHLFPTMPRPNLARCSHLVKEFCADNALPYLVDGYWAGYSENLRQLAKMATVAEGVIAKK